jgi:tetratricopeptide (TPR) repeat protein
MRVYGGGAYPAYIVDPDTLREELLSEEDTLEWLQEVPDDPYAPSFWRMLGELDKALETGEARLAEAEPGTPSWSAAAVRLAQVHHERGEHPQAYELLAGAEEMAGEDPRLLSAVLHERARALLDQGHGQRARADADRAVRLRDEAGDQDGAGASRELLERIERALREGGDRLSTV